MEESKKKAPLKTTDDLLTPIVENTNESDLLSGAIMNPERLVTFDSFYGEYHGHRIDDLRNFLENFKNMKPHGINIFLAGDSSLDNKFWFDDTAPALNGYEKLLDPPISRQDISFWINYELMRRGLNNATAINAAVEESTVGMRACCQLLKQDYFIRDNISQNDVLIVSVGGNDIALRPNPCTILHMITLMKCCPTSCLESLASGCFLPCDDYCCGCITGCLSDFLACPAGYGYFLHLFGARIQSFVDRLTSKQCPRVILVCMIYYPDEVQGGSWADRTLGVLGYNSEPRKLQLLIDRVFRDATSKIKVPGTTVIPVSLSRVLNGKTTSDYSQRVEPSAKGGHKMAGLFLDVLQEFGLTADGFSSVENTTIGGTTLDKNDENGRSHLHPPYGSTDHVAVEEIIMDR